MKSNVLASPAGTAIIVVVIILILLATAVLILQSRLKKCPSDKIMVVYGKVKGAGSSLCLHGGTKFIWPFIQAYQFLDLTPMSINIDLKKALSRQNIRIDVPSIFTVAISNEPGIMQNAAERLLGLHMEDIQNIAKDVIFGQLRLVIATMDIEEINTDRDKFLEAVSKNVEGELKKIGLKLINVNVTDINDESGYIDALGKEAAAKAINDEKKSVAEKNRDGSVGEANAQSDQRIQVATANLKAVQGENLSYADMSQSNATRREVEAESLRRATAAEKIAAAKALQEAYSAEEDAELKRAARETATLKADVIVRTEIEKEKLTLQAEAEAEQIRRKARGEADAIYAKLEAEARGQVELLKSQAVGFGEIVAQAGGNADDAVKLLIADKLETLVKTQVDAVKNLKIDKITVWDGMNGKDGSSTTSNFMSSMFKAIPPLNEVFKMSGMKLPDYLGKVDENAAQ
jgi:flotillin